MDEKYVVKGFYDSDYRGLDTDFKSDDWSQVEMAAHEMLSNGNYVQITNTESGLDYKIEPDEYFNDFNGEFPIKPEALEADKSLDHEIKKYSVESYYGTDTNGHPFGLESSMETDEWSQVEENAHEMLSSGKNVTITDKETGKSLEIVSDAYIENFEGEFPFKPQDLEQSLEEKAVELMNDFFQSFQKNDIPLSEEAKAHNKETTLNFLRTEEGREQFKDQLAYIAEQNPSMAERAAALSNELDSEYNALPYSLPEGMYEIIYEMDAGEKIHLDEYLDDIVLEIKKDEDFTRGIIMETVLEDEFNMVTVDFQKDGKSIASTSDIHVQDLESVLDAIRNGDTSYLIDTDKSLKEIIAENEKSSITREEVIQYCLNQGTGIVNYVDTPAADLETAETTQAERDAAAKSGHEPREVAKATVDYFYEAAQSEPTVNRAIKEDMSLLDLDEWQATNEITGVQLSWEDAREIINVLYENYDISPMDCEASENTRTIAEAFGIDDLSPKHELVISDILDKYEGAKVEFDKSRLSEYNLADTIEQHFFERGEYEFEGSDRIRWLDGLPPFEELRGNEEAMNGARMFVAATVENALKTAEGREALKGYLDDEMHELDKKDFPDDYKRAEDCKRLIEMPTLEYLQDNFTLQSAYEFLENKYPEISVTEFYDDESVKFDTVYVNTNPHGSYAPDDIDDSFDVDYEGSGINEALSEIHHDLNKFLEDGTLEPVCAIDKGGNAMLVPFMVDTESGSYLSFYNEIVPKLENIIEKDNPFKAEQGYVDRQGEFDSFTFDVNFEAETVGLEGMYDEAVSHFKELIQEGERSLEAAKEGEDKTMSNKEWQNYGDVGFLDEGGVQVRETDREGCYDVVLLVQHPENEDKMFAGHTTIDINDYRDTDRIIEAVTESFGSEFNDEQLAVAIVEHEGLVELSMTAFNENGAQAAYAMNYEAYEVDKLELGNALIEMGIDDKTMKERVEELRSDFVAQSVKEEMSQVLADVVSAAGYEIDKIEDDRFALFNTETKDYVKDDFNFMYVVSSEEATELMTQLGDFFERVQNDLEEELENSEVPYLSTENDMPSSPEEWLEFAANHEGDKFVEEHKFSFDALNLYEHSDFADVEIAFQKQTQAAEKAKEVEKETPKKSRKSEGGNDGEH